MLQPFLSILDNYSPLRFMRWDRYRYPDTSPYMSRLGPGDFPATPSISGSRSILREPGLAPMMPPVVLPPHSRSIKETFSIGKLPWISRDMQAGYDYVNLDGE